jgi:hypothetical protein
LLAHRLSRRGHCRRTARLRSNRGAGDRSGRTRARAFLGFSPCLGKYLKPYRSPS